MAGPAQTPALDAASPARPDVCSTAHPSRAAAAVGLPCSTPLLATALRALNVAPTVAAGLLPATAARAAVGPAAAASAGTRAAAAATCTAADAVGPAQATAVSTDGGHHCRRDQALDVAAAAAASSPSAAISAPAHGAGLGGVVSLEEICGPTKADQHTRLRALAAGSPVPGGLALALRRARDGGRAGAARRRRGGAGQARAGTRRGGGGLLEQPRWWVQRAMGAMPRPP